MHKQAALSGLSEYWRREEERETGREEEGEKEHMELEGKVMGHRKKIGGEWGLIKIYSHVNIK